MENKLGRLLRSDEDVHHGNEKKNIDRIGNLVVLTKSQHARIHALGRAKPDIKLKCMCGRKFKLKAYVYRLRKSRNKTKRLFCSRSCGVKYQPRNLEHSHA